MRTIAKIIMFILCSIPVAMYAQTDSTTDKFSFRIGVYYNSHLNYYGRTDSLRSSGVFTVTELWFNKFYINAAPVFTSNSVMGFQYAGTVTTAGYFNSNRKSSVHIYLVKPIYKDNSQLVQSALKAQTAASFTKFNKVLNITGGVDIKFSNNIDYGANLGLDHIFRKQLQGNSILVVNPSISLYAGTQQFNKTYYEKSSFLLLPGIDRAVTENMRRFNILSYEFSLPVIFVKGKWMALATPAYVIPQNLLEVEGRPDLSERGKNMFYITAGIKANF